MDTSLSKHQLITKIQAGLTELGLITSTRLDHNTSQHIHLAHQILLTLRTQDHQTLSVHELTERINGKTPLLARSLAFLEEHQQVELRTPARITSISLTSAGLTHANSLESLESSLLRQATFIPNTLLATLIDAIQCTVKDLNAKAPALFHYICPNCTFHSTRLDEGASTIHYCSYLESVIDWMTPPHTSSPHR